MSTQVPAPVLAVIIPTLNEAGNIGWLFRRFVVLLKLLNSSPPGVCIAQPQETQNQPTQQQQQQQQHIPNIQTNTLMPTPPPLLNPTKLHLVFVDDGSRDRTREVIKKMAQKKADGLGDTQVTVMARTKKHGLGNAYRDAVSVLTEGKRNPPALTAIMDADGSHDPVDLARMVTRMLNSERRALCVIGSRYVRGGAVDRWGPARRILSLGANATSRVLMSLSGIPGTRLRLGGVQDTSDSFRVYDTLALRDAMTKVTSTGFSIQEELLFRLMLVNPSRPVLEEPIFFRMRRKGESKCGIKEVVLFAVAVLRLFLLE